MATERRYTANEALELLLMNDDDFREATITLLPPGDGQQSDEDSGDEEQSEFHQLSRNQLLAEADLCVDYGSHIVSTLADDVEVAVMQQPRRSSRLRASDPDEESELDVSADLWGNGDGEDPGESVPEKFWLSGQLPTSQPTLWETRDIDAKTFSDIPEESLQSFSSNITPFSIFNLFFDDVVIDFIVDMTNLYAQQDKNLTTFRTDNAEIRVFIAILMLSGYNTRPRLKMYWDRSPDVNCAAVSNAMPRKRFEQIMMCLHLSDNLNLDPNDKMAKIRPFYNLINKKFLRYRLNNPNLSVDEAMLPYFGRNSSKQRIQNKPVRVGYKMWVLAEDSGYVVQFDPYQGAKLSGPQRSSPQTWGLGEKVVLELLETLPKGPSYHVFMDNFFTSVRLMTFLGNNNIRASGTLRQGRIPKACAIPTKMAVQKMKRGFSYQKTATDNSVSVVAWKDNKVVFFTSNCSSRAPEVPVRRYCRDAKQRILVNQPLCISQYNRSMGGVDRADQNVSQYRICIRSKKWWWALFAWVPDVVLQNAWILYRKYKKPSDPKHDLLSFRREVVSVYLTQYSRNNQSVSDPCTANFSRRLSSSVRLDKQGHYSEACQTTKRCGLCRKTTRKWCPKCKKGVHDHCFNTFHGFCE